MKNNKTKKKAGLLFSKIGFYFRKFWHWVIVTLNDWRTALIFLIVWLLFNSPIIVGVLVWLITKKGWWLAMASGWFAFWALPFTPAVLIELAITVGIKKLFKIKPGKKISDSFKRKKKK